MEEHPNVAAARSGYEAFARQDMNALNELMSDDVVWHVGGHNPLTGDYKGKEEVFGFFAKVMQETNGTFGIDVHDILGNDEHVVVLARITGERTGKNLDQRVANIQHADPQNRVTEFWSFPEDGAAVDEFWS